MTVLTSPPRTRPRFGPHAGLVAATRGVAFTGLMLAGLGLLIVIAGAVFLTALGAGVLIVGNGGPRDQRVLLALVVIGAGLGLGQFAVPPALLGIRGLALDTPARINLASELDGRPQAPVESAAYFAACEALANAVRHAEATHGLAIDIRHETGCSAPPVTDDGRGGAGSWPGGTGLAGIRRRLATFDGTLTVHSPRGGPTELTMELPCESSWPKTSTS